MRHVTTINIPCRHCGISVSSNNFTGARTICLACRTQRRIENQKRYRQSLPKKLREPVILPCERCGIPVERKIAWRGIVCDSCKKKQASDQAKKRYDENPTKQKAAIRRTKIKSYGLTIEQYQAMVERQGNKCAICGISPFEMPLDIDHSHRTGKVRGLLCRRCNIGLGLFYDDPHNFRRALSYLAQVQ